MPNFFQLVQKHWLKVLIGLLLTVAGLWLAFRDVNLQQIFDIVRQVKIPWLAVFGFLTLFQIFVRGLRWHYLSCHHKKMPVYSLYKISTIGFALNSILPLRIGEFARAVLLKKKHDVSFSFGFSTIVVERVYDFLVILILFTPLLLRLEIPPDFEMHFENYVISAQLIQTLVRNVAYMTSLGLVVLVAFQFSLFQNMGLYILDIVGKVLPRVFYQKLRTMYLHLVHGFQSFKNAKNVLITLLLSFLVWLIIGLSFYTASLAIPQISLNYIQSLFTSLMICFGIMIPSAPGYWGLFELAGKFALVLLGFNEDIALSYTLVVHFVQMLFIVFFGLFYLSRTGLSLHDIISDDDIEQI